MNTKKIFPRFIILLLILGSSSSFHCASPVSTDFIQKDVLTFTAQILLPNVSGRIDHLAYDSIKSSCFCCRSW